MMVASDRASRSDIPLKGGGGVGVALGGEPDQFGRSDLDTGVPQVVGGQTRPGHPSLYAAPLPAVTRRAGELVVDGQGSGLWPHSPAMALGPSTSLPRITTPPPTPVPMITPNTDGGTRRGAVDRLG